MAWHPLAAATGQPILLLVIGLALVVLKFRAAIARGVVSILLPHPRPGYGSLSPTREEGHRRWRRDGAVEPIFRGVLTLWASAVLVVAILSFLGIMDALLPE